MVISIESQGPLEVCLEYLVLMDRVSRFYRGSFGLPEFVSCNDFGFSDCVKSAATETFL